MLKNLQEIVEATKIRIENDFNPRSEDIRIPDGILSSDLFIKSNEHTAIIQTDKNYVYVPNQWFSLAYYLSDYSNALDEYRSHFDRIFNNLSRKEQEDLAKRARSDNLSDEEIQQINNAFDSNQDVEYFIKWLTSYVWWAGSKTVDRDDFKISPLLTLANVPQASQTYLVSLIELIGTNAELINFIDREITSNVQQDEVQTDSELIHDFYSKWRNDLIDSGYSIPQFFPFETALNQPDEVDLRLVLSLQAKRFLILTGLAGSGKTKIAQLFAQWITESSTRDPFEIGTEIEGDSSTYTVVESGPVAIEIEGGSRQVIPRRLISEWADYINNNDLEESSPQEVRSLIAAERQDDDLFLRSNNVFHSPLKAAALHLIQHRSVYSDREKSYLVLPVGADWTNRDPILGYPDILNNTYRSEPALDLILRAIANPNRPHILILDEMNLSHVERYFADILSAIESNEELILYEGQLDTHIRSRIVIPSNLYIIGTVNVDETTYTFSPKVLDRANVIEFRTTANSIKQFTESQIRISSEKIAGKGKSFAKTFVFNSGANKQLGAVISDVLKTEVIRFFDVMSQYGMEFGFRAVEEIERYIALHFEFRELSGDEYLTESSGFRSAFDAQIMQKLLPRLSGSRRKLEPLIIDLIKLCYDWESSPNRREILQDSFTVDWYRTVVARAKYPVSFEKLTRMLKRLEDGFTSFTEA